MEKRGRLLPSKSTTGLGDRLKSMTLSDLEKHSAKLQSFLDLSKKKLACEDMAEFMREILKLQTWRHILEWISLLETEKNLLIEASRDHAKSYTLSYAYPLFRVQRARDVREGFRVALMSY